MTGAERPAAVCARCGMAINYMLKITGRQDDPEFVWVHGGPADHDPVLAPSAGSPRLYCDFCSAPDPGWVIDTDRDFQIVVVDRDGGSLTENFTGGWAACDQCAELVAGGQRRALLARAVASIPFATASEHAAYRARTAQVHAAFFASGPHPPRRTARLAARAASLVRAQSDGAGRRFRSHRSKCRQGSCLSVQGLPLSCR